MPATAGGLVAETQLSDAGVTSTLTDLDDVTATLDLTYTLNHDGSLFFEWGNVTFGDGARSSLTFASIGAGTIGAPDVDGFSHGTIMSSLQAGSGQFDGATGLITSNFLADVNTNELIDVHLAVIRLP